MLAEFSTLFSCFSRFLVDTDAGVDDAMALLILLRTSSTSAVEGIVASRGNAAVDDVAKNVQRVLRLSEKV